MSEEKKEKESNAYQFSTIKKIKHTSVKSQGRTGTCWSFATIAFLESEVLRQGKIKDLDLSEMYIVRHTYPKKAQNYIRMHGSATWGQGGQSHDVIDQMREFGIVPESVFNGKKIGQKDHNHSELSRVLKGMLDGILKSRKPTPVWLTAFNHVLDTYLGITVDEFEFDGKRYTPKSFMKYLELNLDDYIELASCTQIPFYKQFRQVIPDNWTYNSNYYNIPLDDLEKAVDHAIEQGYSVCWDADISDKYFNTKKMFVALVPEKDDRDKTKKEKEAPIEQPIKEKIVNQELRQQQYDNFVTTDDHLMHLVGLAKDQKGNKYYIIKNSWGTKDMKYKGYFYISKAYFRLRTINIMVNKNSLPQELKTKLGM
jgi:bleomycin hydrolase